MSGNQVGKISDWDLLKGVAIHFVSIPIVGMFLAAIDNGGTSATVGWWVAWAFFGFGFMPAVWGYLLRLFREL